MSRARSISNIFGRVGAATAAVVAFAGAMLLAASSALADPGRYALLVGSNHGAPGDISLRFAVQDARRAREVLNTMGGFASENTVILENPTADRVRDGIALINARIRAETTPAHGSFLFVYLSGHADAEALHLGRTALPWDELRNSVAGSSAGARVLVIDTCRSGQATRVKGTALDEPFALRTALQTPQPEGFAILSSAAAGEVAQESDDLSASFFTHHLLAGLSGVADTDQDGMVTLAEAYRYAADRTVSSTVKTWAGVQHPTYRYELKGRSDVVITQVSRAQELAALRLVRPGVYLVRGSSSAGPLVLEAAVADKPRTVRLPPGRYLVQRRSPEHLDEATLELRSGNPTETTAIHFRPIRYDQLVRKGGSRTSAHAVAAWASAGSYLLHGFSNHYRGALSYTHETPSLSIDATIGGAFSRKEAPGLTSNLQIMELLLGGRKVFDVGRSSLSLGIRTGAMLVFQSYGDRDVPTRRLLAPLLDTVVRYDLRIGQTSFIAAEGIVRGSYTREITSSADASTRTPIQAFLGLGFGKMW